MSNELNSVFDYTSLDYLSIMSLLKNMNNRYISNDKRKILVDILIIKYFTLDKSFDLYSFLNQSTVWLTIPDRLTIGCNLLMTELIKTSDIELKDEYKESFFRYLLDFLGFVDKLPEKTNNDIEVTFDFSSMPKLIDYLSDANKLGITSASLRANLNALVERIKKNLEERSRNVEDRKGLVSINDTNSLKTIESVKKVEDIKELKLIKSQLTQSKLEGIVSDFKLYSQKDKFYIIQYVIKKNWDYLLFKIPYVDSFDFLVSNLEYQDISAKFNLLRLFSISFKSNYDYLGIWKKYFNVNTLIEVFDAVKVLYLKLTNDTSVNFEDYYHQIVKEALKSKNYFEVADTSELIEFRRNELCLDFDSDFDKLLNCVNFTLFDWVNEKLIFERKSICLLEYYFSIFKKYSCFFFNCHVFTTEKYTIKFADCVSNINREKIERFVNLIGKVVFTGDMLTEVCNKFELNSHFTRIGEVDLSTCLNEFIRIYFCYHYNNKQNFLDVVWVKNIVYSPTNLVVFKKVSNKITYQGAFHDSNSYIACLFEVLSDVLDFSKAEDFNIVYVLGVDYLRSNKKILELILNKLKVEKHVCYALLLDYTEGQIMERCEGMFAFLKTYYGLNK